MRIGLGTVQFGADYGISNTLGKVSGQQVSAILQEASLAGISVLDTASLYGDSETVLGDYIPFHSDFKIVSKTLVCKLSSVDDSYIAAVETTVHSSLQNLRIDKIYGLLIHHARDVFKPGGEKIVALLKKLKSQGLVQKIGVSIYDGDELDRVLEEFTPDLVQLPVNLLDQRLLASGHIAKLKALGVEIHTRSLFLQGALLIESTDLPAYFEPVRHKFEAVSKFSEMHNLCPMTTCILFGLLQRDIDVLLIGVTSVDELMQIIEAVKTIDSQARPDFRDLALNEPQYVNPANWPTTKA